MNGSATQRMSRGDSTRARARLTSPTQVAQVCLTLVRPRLVCLMLVCLMLAVSQNALAQDAESATATEAASTAQTEAGQPARPPAAEPAPAQAPPPVPSEPLGATAQREHVDDEPPDGFDLSRFPDEPVRRSGFTLELGFGLALSHITGDYFDSTEVGLAPPSLSLGGFIAPNPALMFRMAGTSWFQDLGFGDSELFASTFYGGAFQYWFDNRAFFGAGLGLGVFDDYLFSDVFDAEVGFMLTGRIGYAFYANPYHAFAFVAEIFPGLYDGAQVFGLALNLEWQLL